MSEQIVLADLNQNETSAEEEFSYEGYQVVRGEFFAHLFEPSVTIANEKVSVNSACIRKLPNTEYVQFLVNPKEKKLAVRPCDEMAKDSFCWAGVGTDGKRKPKTISCRIFFAKVMNLMGWNPDYRYKILGKLKLVRDRIPEIIKADGKNPITRILPKDEYLQELDTKLNEEVAEYQADKSIEEMADVLEVLFAICEARGYSIEQLMKVKQDKQNKRGGFKDRVFWEGNE